MSIRPHFPRRSTHPASRPRTRSSGAGSLHPHPPTRVELRVAPDLSQLMTLRALAEATGLQAGLNTAEIIDLGLAIDEAATGLMHDPVPGCAVICEIAVDARRVTVRLAGVTGGESVLGPAQFGWHILQSLTERAESSQEPYDVRRGGYPTVVEFSHLRQRALRAVR